MHTMYIITTYMLKIGIQPNLLSLVETFRGWSLMNGFAVACVDGATVVVTGIPQIHATRMQINEIK